MNPNFFLPRARARHKPDSAAPLLWPDYAWVPESQVGGASVPLYTGAGAPLAIQGTVGDAWRSSGLRVHNSPSSTYANTTNPGTFLPVGTTLCHPMTIVCLFTPLEVGANGDIMFLPVFSGQATFIWYRMQCLSNGSVLQVQFRMQRSSGQGNTITHTDNAVVGRRNFYIVTSHAPGGQFRLYLNGVGTTPAGTNDPDVSQMDRFQLGAAEYNGSTLSTSAVEGIIHYAAIYLRYLHPSEAAMLSADPYRWIRSTPQVLASVGAAGASGLLTHPGMAGGMRELTGGMHG